MTRISLILCFVALTSVAHAQLITTGDDSAARTPAAVPPMPLSVGINNGFGGQIGTGVTFVWDTDVLGNVSLDILGGACMGSTGNPDTAVIYLDVDRTAGFNSTVTFSDNGSQLRAAASGVGTGGGNAPLTFSPTFTADYAIAFFNADPTSGRPPTVMLMRLVAGGAHVPVGTLNIAQIGAMGCAALRIDGMTLADLGLQQGDLFRWVTTLLNANNAFRSNEFHGSTYGGANIGVTAFAMAMGDHNVFTSVGRVFINEVDADTPSTDAAEFIELLGPAGVRLDGTVVTIFNGSGDSSYNAIDLDGGVTDATGYYVIGSATVPNVDNVAFTTNGLQNGADAAAFYLGDASDFPSSTGVTTTNLVDALVYDTSDGDDAGLAPLMLPGEPQVNEAGGSDKDIQSSSRCANGSGGYRVTSTYIPVTATPGVENACPVCGDGTLEFGEECDDGGANGTAASCCATGCSFRPADEVCALASGACDVADTCDGAGTCDSNVEAAGIECRAAVAGGCDIAETCDGTLPGCPTDVVEASTVECRASAGTCDVAENCTGSSGACPGDGFRSAAIECRASAGTCDVAENCSGAAAVCPSDMSAPNGTSCADATVCDGSEMCMAGSCVAGTALVCDDSDLCTADSCAEPGGCEASAIAGCCNLDAECNDSDLCTADSCSGAGGTCSSSPITDCCEFDVDCGDGNDCTADSCDLGTNRCVRTPIAGCCALDTDCGDGNACTTDTCDAGTGECTNAMVAGCCLADGDCDDSDTCTADACDLSANTCTNDAVAGCCTADGDCDDADMCTTDTCNVGTATCDNAPIDGCASMDAGVDGGMDGGTDAGTDAGPIPDSGTDAATGDSATGDSGVDSGTSGASGGGCGCAVPGQSPAPGFVLLVLLGLAVRRRQ